MSAFKKVRLGLALGVVLALIVLAMAFSLGCGSGTSGTAGSGGQVGEKGDKEASGTPKSGEVVPAKTVVTVGKWAVAAGVDPGVQFKDRLGSEFLSITADDGYTYALVPLAVKNITKQTESLMFVTWKLSDDGGLVDETETMADTYLSEKARLDLTNVAPEATRTGYLVFQVKKGARRLVLSMGTTVGKARWKLN